MFRKIMSSRLLMTENEKLRREIMERAMKHVYFLAVELGERTLREYDNLNHAGFYIKDYIAEFGHRPLEEKYMIGDRDVSNIIVEIPGTDQKDNIIVLGAHYDTVEGSPGADDNASSVAGLLEIYRMLSGLSFRKTIRFVAFTMEEPPHFGGPDMGSMRHAAGCRKRGENIELMICLEMIGYGGKKCVQKFPMPELKVDNPRIGDYLCVLGLPSSAPYVDMWKNIYNRYARRQIFDFVGPASIPGMDLSDHRSFIRHEYPAIMLSDTGQYRNRNYHMPDDTADRLNFEFLADNILNTCLTLRDILNMDVLMGKKY
jgi:Zn-dependent M28 family amino/carboxypeptidase